MVLKRTVPNAAQAANTVRVAHMNRERFNQMVQKRRLEKLAQSAKRGHLTNREKDFLMRRNAFLKAQAMAAQAQVIPVKNNVSSVTFENAAPLSVPLAAMVPAAPVAPAVPAAPTAVKKTVTFDTSVAAVATVATATRIPRQISGPKTSLNDYFDKIYVLNMKRRLDRWFAMVKRFERLGITDYERFIGVDGYSEPYKSQWEAYSKKPFNVFDKKFGRKAIRSPGVWGILKGMLKMFTTAKKNGYRNFFVFQDDAMFHHNFNALFAEKMRKIPRDYKVIYLGVTQPKFTKQMNEARDYYHPMGLADGAYAVGFHESVYDFMIKQINTMVMPFDSGPLMSSQRMHAEQNIVVKPQLVMADVTESDCRDGRSNSEFSKIVHWDYSKFREFEKLSANPMITVVMVLSDGVGADYVREALSSMFYQSYKNIEIIVFDNASSSVMVVEEMSRKAPTPIRIKVYRSGVVMPESVYYNMGLLLTRGEVVVFHSPLYKSLTTRFAQQIGILQRNQCQVVSCTPDAPFISAMYTRKLLAEVGYLETFYDVNECFYEFYEKTRVLGHKIAVINERYYIPYACLCENREVVELPDRSRIEMFAKYGEWLKSKGSKTPQYRAFPAKKATPGTYQVDVDVVSGILGI